jgi:hypothetical protein
MNSRDLVRRALGLDTREAMLKRVMRLLPAALEAIQARQAQGRPLTAEQRRILELLDVARQRRDAAIAHDA